MVGPIASTAIAIDSLSDAAYLAWPCTILAHRNEPGMYKLLLCWRYLRTRYIALASIVSVMLGVAVMIVVNAVMEGFSHEMQSRMHDVLSDVVVESRSLEGMCDAKWHMEQIASIVGDDVVGMTPTAHVPAMLGFQVGDQHINKQVTIIGIDQETYAEVSSFGNYLQHPENREHVDFKLKEQGYDTIDHSADDPTQARPRKQMEFAGWKYRRQKALFAPKVQIEQPAEELAADPFAGATPVDQAQGEGHTFNPATEQHAGCVMGIAIASFRGTDGNDGFLLLPGDDIEVTYPSAGRVPKPLSAKFTLVDFYESKMNEYDASFMFVPLAKLQDLRGMIDPASGKRYVNSIQLKLREGANLNAVRDKLRESFPAQLYVVSTWRDKQGPLLAAVQMETAVLNVLLFMIVAVAGFGILAIFFMIVVEKTRDIGILKSLGASGTGIMSIFLTYGLSLGVVGAGVGSLLGLYVVANIDNIADLLGQLTGQEVFDPTIYYFYKIPTVVNPLTVGSIVVGAMAIAILASILPAIRASRLHPVQALRFE
jgi:lipoprotein-releasing system permease protein